MATGIKSTVDPSLLSYTMWAAWGAIDIEALGREPRRNYLMTVRAELATRGYGLAVGGTGKHPYYRIFKDARELVTIKDQWQTTKAAGDAFAKVCKEFLEKEDPSHANTVDGSTATG